MAIAMDSHEIELWFCCAFALSTLSKNRVIIRNRKAEYSTLYDLAIDVLSKERMQLRPEVMHGKLADGIMCKPCFSKVKKLTEALNVTKPIHKTMDVPGSRDLDRSNIQ